MARLWCFIRGSQKALTGLAVSAALYLGTRYGLKLGPEAELTITGLVTAAFVYLVPNVRCDES